MPRRLVLTDEAVDDIARRAETLRDARGTVFARDWSEALLDWLEKNADSGAQLGTEHAAAPEFRTFGYRRQATVLARFAPETLTVLRIYFPGQDWTR